MGCCASTFQRAPTSARTAPKTLRPWRSPSTAGRERPLAGGHRPRLWTSSFDRVTEAVLRRPLESTLFLWLAMLGSVIAFQRGEHMRMTAIVGMLGPRARAFLDVVAVAAPLAFLLLVLHPAYEFAADEVFVTTPALEIPNAWRAAALPVGIALMLAAALLRLAAVADWRHVAGALALVAALAGLMVLLSPALKPLGNL